jgi:16S rRNA processing protein RimM
VGHILDAWGVRGWVKVAPDAPQATALLKSKTWWLSRPALKRAHADCGTSGSASRQRPGRTARRTGRPQRRRSAARASDCRATCRLPPPDEGEFYWADLIGCEVRTLEGADLGRVTGLMESAAHAVLRVQIPQTSADAKPRERLIPFVEAYIVSVDLPAKTVIALWDASYD